MSHEDYHEMIVVDHHRILHHEDLDNESVTHECLRELETEEYFIDKLKKQREKVELLRVEFQ